METFPRFSSLPPELRLQIWSTVLHEEAEQRLVVLHGRRVVPFKFLISPLLSANFESRCLAREFYNVRLVVHATPTPNFPGDSELFGKMGEILAGVEPFGKRKGAIFISPEFDTFVYGVDCRDWYCDALGDDLVNPEVLVSSRCHVAAELPRRACRAVRELVRAETRDEDVPHDPDEENPYECTPEDVRLLWQTDVFTGIREYGHVWLGDCGHTGDDDYEGYLRFLNEADRYGGTADFEIRRWTWGKETKTKTRVLRDVEMSRKWRAKIAEWDEYS